MNIYEQVLTALKTKFQGAEVAILQRTVSKKSGGVVDESKVSSTAEGISFQDVLSSCDDYRADRAQKTTISNYEKKHNIKNSKPIGETKPQTPTLTPQPKPVEEVPAWAQSLIDSNKALSEKLTAMDAKTKADIHGQQIDKMAESFGVPEFTYKDKQIVDDAGFDQCFTDLEWEMQNSGFQSIKSPEEGNHEHQSEIGSIAEQIEKGIREIVEQSNKQKLWQRDLFIVRNPKKHRRSTMTSQLVSADVEAISLIWQGWK